MIYTDVYFVYMFTCLRLGINLIVSRSAVCGNEMHFHEEDKTADEMTKRLFELISEIWAKWLETN